MIYSKDLNEYWRYIKIVLNKLFIRRLRCRLEKYKFYKTEINFLRFITGIDGIKIDLVKVEVVKE